MHLRRAVDGSVGGRSAVLRVSLRDATRLLGCVHNRKADGELLQLLFRFKWCWRPEEMTEPRYDAKTNTTTDVCVWGFKVPEPPRQC